MAKRKSTPTVSSAAALPENPLIGAKPADTLNNVSALMTWLDWHPIEGGAVPSDNVAPQLEQGDYLVRKLLHDAVKFESKRAEVAHG